MATPTLRGRITLNDSLFTSGLRNAKNEGIRWSKQMGSNLKGFLTQPIAQIGAALVAAVSYRAFQAGIQGSIGLGDELYRLNVKTGIAVGSLAQLKKLSLETSSDFGTLTLGVSRMQRSLVEASKSGSGPAAATFRLMGIEISDLVKLRPEQQFQKIGQAITALPNPALRTAAAMKLFGRSGAELLPVFAQIGNADFGHLDAKSQALEDSAKAFHEITVSFKKIGSNLQSFFIGFAQSFAPILQAIGGLSAKNPFLAWGQAIGRFATLFVEFEVGLYGFAKDFIEVLVNAFKQAFGKLQGPMAAFLAPLKDFFETLGSAFADAFKGIVGKVIARGKSALGVTDPESSVAPVVVDGYGSPLDNGHSGLRSGSLAIGPALWKSLFAPKWNGRSPLNFGGTLSRGAFGQAGGLGSLSGTSNSGFAGLDLGSQMAALLSPSEIRSVQNQKVASGEERGATSPYAYGAVSAGDDQRRKAYLKQQLLQKVGVDKSNELLEQIAGNTEELKDEWQ